MKFVFATPPAPGHVYPAVPLVEELVSRGHQVSYVTSRRMSAAVAAAGATPVELDWEPETSSLTEFTADTLLTTLESYLAAVRTALPGLLAHFRPDPPDVVCADAVVLGPLLGAAFEAPLVSLVPNFAQNEHTGPGLVPGFEQAGPRFAAYGAEVGTLFAEHGLGAGDAELTLAFLPREFQPAGDTFGDDVHFIGPSVSRSRAGHWPGNDAPVLLISLGTAFTNRPRFFAACAEAFGDTRWHVVLSVGEHVVAGPAAPNIEMHASVPQPAVLARASAFITHAGMGSVMEALLSGVPMLTVPQVHEQSRNADRVAELGLGRALDLAGDLRQQVEAVAADPAIRANLAAMRTAIEAAGGAAAGADAIERLLASDA